MTRRTRSVPVRPVAVVTLVVAMVGALLVSFAAPASAVVFSNPATITVPDAVCSPAAPGQATPYPSNISVAGLTGTVTDVNVTLNSINSDYAGDLEVLLVGPAGGAQNLLLLSDAGQASTSDLTNTTIVFDDAAASQLPQGSPLGGANTTVTAKPSNYTEVLAADVFPAPAPAPSASTTLAGAFNGIVPNGTWRLYVIDDGCGDAADTIAGWSVDITTAAAAATTTTAVTSSLNPSRTGQSVTFTATVTSTSTVNAGTVTFTEGATTLAANVPVNASGQASFTKSNLTEGNHVITATYSGTVDFATSNGSVNQRVDNNTVVTDTQYCNTGPITVNAAAPATPYPSNIFVTGAPASISKVTATLKNVTHTFPDDIDALLVGPGGQNLVLLSDAGNPGGPSGSGANNVTAVFDDAAAGQLAQNTPWGAPGSTVSTRPVDYDPSAEVDVFAAPAPPPSSASTLATFNAASPNGTWSLYVTSDGAPDTGSIAGGWCLTFTAALATPTITTFATTPVTIGSPIADIATVTGAASPAPAPTGTVVFTLFGPANPTCTGAPIFTSAAQPLAGSPPPTANSGSFTPTAVGTYNWVASYSGDTGYAAVTSPCGAANETSVVNQAVATIATSATTPVTIGSPISDTATVTGAASPAPAPTGTVFFTLFGPGNPTCTGTPIFTSAAQSLAGGPPPTAASGNFTPTTPGTYNWVAVYSGDANYPGVTSPCGAANESSVVTQAAATITTFATTPVTIGSPIADIATVTGAASPAPAPTGTVVFTLFGPANPTCTGAPIFTSAAQPLAGGPPPTAASGNFTPTALGTYNWVAVYSGDANYPGVTSPCGAANEASVVTQATPTIATSATTPVTIGSPISDAATVTGAASPAPTPTGTVVFTLFGPGNPTCTGAPIFTSAAQSLAGGPPPTANSGPFTPTAPGTYNWVAVYSGDTNYAGVTSPCGAPNESSVVTQAVATIATSATTPVTIGSPIADIATVTGAASPAPAPTGTVVFTLFGPGNPTCTGAPIFTSAAQPLAGSPPPTANSGPFTPTAPGTYNWVAVYSGDTNYAGVTSPCGAPNETSVVTQATATIATSATTPVTIGSPIADIATVTGAAAPAPAPTGTVVFTLFGPGDPTCTGAPIFTSAAQPLAGGPPPTAASGNFTPTTPGTYNWVAVYSGDANYAGVTSPCGAADETSVVTQATGTIATSATTTVPIGSPIADTATVTGAASPAPTPTGTVVFTLFGPGNPTCTGAPIFTSAAQSLAGGPPPTAGSGNFTPTALGTYNWVAVYSGDANYAGLTSPCGAPNESSVVTKASPTLVTTASVGGPVGTSVTDTAALAGGVGATGTITFTLFGPDDATCSGAAAFTTGVTVSGNGNYTTPPFAPAAAGVYRWTADYPGDAQNNAASSACNAANESVTITKASPTLTTTASAASAIGGQVHDTAVLAAGAAPTGSILFSLYGPDDATCSGAAIFTSPVTVAGNGSYDSADFTPPAPGTYRWTATYSGDANNNPATSACNAPDESVTIVKASPTLTTQASPGNFLGAPVRDVATLTGGFGPTGTVAFRLFTDNTCTTEMFTSTNPVSGATATSDWFVPASTGTFFWTAAYSGDGNNNAAASACQAPNESVTIAPFEPPTPTRTISGDLLGPVTVGSGESVLITSARVVGPITVNPGGALTVVNSQITRGITANAPSFFSLCGVQVSAPPPATALSVTNAPVPIRIGDPATGCAGNRFAGQVSLTNNLAVMFGANIVSHNTTIDTNGPGTTVIKANRVFGALGCAGNNPPPTNAGQVNTAGSKTGQCAAL